MILKSQGGREEELEWSTKEFSEILLAAQKQLKVVKTQPSKPIRDMGCSFNASFILGQKTVSHFPHS